MAQLAEVALAQPEQRGAVEALEHDRLSVPVLLLARHVVAALEQQDAFAGGSEAVGQGAAARAGADDDDVIVVHARLLRSAVAIMRGAGEWFQTRYERVAWRCSQKMQRTPLGWYSLAQNSALAPRQRR